MATTSILAFREGTFSSKTPVHSWKAGPGEVMTVENFSNPLEQCAMVGF